MSQSQHTTARWILWILSFIWVALGVLFLVSPTLLFKDLGIQLTTADAATEIRAFYGGSQLGMGIWLGICAKKEDWLLPGLLSITFVTGMMLLFRIVFLVATGSTHTGQMTTVGVEIVGTLLPLWAIRSVQKSS